MLQLFWRFSGFLIVSMKEWLCRSKLRRVELERQATRRGLARTRDAEVAADATVRRNASVSAVEDVPPAYNTLYSAEWCSQHSLPVALRTQRCNGAATTYSANLPDRIFVERTTSSPPYSEEDGYVESQNEELPSYADATSGPHECEEIDSGATTLS